MATTAVASTSTDNVRRAKHELDKMRSSLRKWLKYRTLVDQVAAGSVSTSKPTQYAAYIATTAQTQRSEQKLATQLSILLAQVYPDMTLPNADISGNALAAVQLAQIALGDPSAPIVTATPTPSAGLAPWVLPVIIASALLIGITTAIKSAADVQMQAEHDACIESGACTDYGWWMKWAAVLGLAWFAWEKMGVGERVKKSLKGGR